MRASRSVATEKVAPAAWTASERPCRLKILRKDTDELVALVLNKLAVPCKNVADNNLDTKAMSS